MAHKYYSKYFFCIGSDGHDSIIDIDAFTKTEAMKQAKAYKVRRTDHIRYYGKEVIYTL